MAVAACPSPDWVSVSGSCYYLAQENATFSGALMQCGSLTDSHLLVVNDDTEDLNVQNILLSGSTSSYWAGSRLASLNGYWMNADFSPYRGGLNQTENLIHANNSYPLFNPDVVTASSNGLKLNYLLDMNTSEFVQLPYICEMSGVGEFCVNTSGAEPSLNESYTDDWFMNRFSCQTFCSYHNMSAALLSRSLCQCAEDIGIFDTVNDTVNTTICRRQACSEGFNGDRCAEGEEFSVLLDVSLFEQSFELTCEEYWLYGARFLSERPIRDLNTSLTCFYPVESGFEPVRPRPLSQSDIADLNATSGERLTPGLQWKFAEEDSLKVMRLKFHHSTIMAGIILGGTYVALHFQ